MGLVQLSGVIEGKMRQTGREMGCRLMVRKYAERNEAHRQQAQVTGYGDQTTREKCYELTGNGWIDGSTIDPLEI